MSEQDDLQWFRDWCKIASYQELLEERKAARFLLQETEVDSYNYKITRKQLGIVEKNIREIERLG